MSESNPEVLKAVRLLVGDIVNKERYVMLPAEPGEGDPVLGKFRTVSDAKRFASRSDITEFSLWTRLKVVGGGSLKEDFNDSDDEEEIDDDSPEEDDDDDEEEDDDDDDIDIGSHIGLVFDDEEVFGKIVEFDDDEGTVTIEEDGTGDLVTGYQEDMFIE